MAKALRNYYVTYKKVLGDSGTETFDINVDSPITELYIEVRANNHATAPNASNPIARNVTKIELVDGGDTLFSLTGQQTIANFFYMTGKMPHRAIQEWDSVRQLDTFPIRFGRYLGDERYALDPRKYQNLQLKITWNLATVNAVGANGFATGTGRMTVVTRIMESPKSLPVGLFTCREIENWTTAASGDHVVDLPTDHKFVNLFFRSYESGIGPDTHFSNFKFSINNDQLVLHDGDTGEVERMSQERLGKATQEIKFYGSDGMTLETWLGGEVRANLNMLSAVNVAGYSEGNGGLLTLDLITNANAAVSNSGGYATIEGYQPEHTFEFPFGDIMDESSWLDASSYGDLKVELTEGNAGGAASLFLLQARKY